MKFTGLILVSISITALLFGETIQNEEYRFTFSLRPDWEQLPSSPNRPLDAIRLYPLEGNRSGQASDYIAARVLLLRYPAGMKRMLEYAKDTIINLQHKYFTVTHRNQQTHKGMAVNYFRLFQAGSEKDARDLWMDVRFFIRESHVYAFYAAAHTEYELEEASGMFLSLDFF